MTKTKIGTIAIQIMEKRGIEYIGYETFGLLDDVHGKAMDLKMTKDTKIPHPLNHHKKVLDTLDRDERFLKHFMQCTNGRAEVLVRYFNIIKSNEING